MKKRSERRKHCMLPMQAGSDLHLWYHIARRLRPLCMYQIWSGLLNSF